MNTEACCKELSSNSCYAEIRLLRKGPIITDISLMWIWKGLKGNEIWVSTMEGQTVRERKGKYSSQFEFSLSLFLFGVSVVYQYAGLGWRKSKRYYQPSVWFDRRIKFQSKPNHTEFYNALHKLFYFILPFLSDVWIERTSYQELIAWMGRNVTSNK